MISLGRGADLGGFRDLFRWPTDLTLKSLRNERHRQMGKANWVSTLQMTWKDLESADAVEVVEVLKDESLPC
jgi:hypothetical protein